MLTVFISTAILTVSAILLSRIYRFYTYWSRNGVKGPNVFESLSSYRRTMHVNDYEWYLKYGNIVGFYDVFRKGILINDPQLIKDITVKDFNIFTNRRYYYLGESLDHGMLDLRDNDWKRVRGVISPAFTSAKLKAMMYEISEITDQFCDKISNEAKTGVPFDLRLYLNAFTLDVISSCAFGIKTDALKDPNHPIVVNGKKLFDTDLSFSLLIGFIAPQISKLLRLEGLDHKALQYFDRLTNEIKNKRREVNLTKTDFIQLMIDANNEAQNQKKSANSGNKRTISDKELTAQGITFFIAGHDTTASTLSHCFYYISKHLDIQQKLYEEISKLEKLDTESLAKLVYLNAVIMETLRIAPAVIRYDREASEDYTLANTGITIPKGTLVTFSAYSVHHNPNLFEDPFDFKPERFISENNQLIDNPHGFIPFGDGPRMCLGMKFAMNEMRICVAKLLIRCRLKLCPDAKLDYFIGSPFMNPSKVLVIAEDRNQVI